MWQMRGLRRVGVHVETLVIAFEAGPLLVWCGVAILGAVSSFSPYNLYSRTRTPQGGLPRILASTRNDCEDFVLRLPQGSKREGFFRTPSNTIIWISLLLATFRLSWLFSVSAHCYLGRSSFQPPTVLLLTTETLPHSRARGSYIWFLECIISGHVLRPRKPET
jgi:hypothetical protein